MSQRSKNPFYDEGSYFGLLINALREIKWVILTALMTDLTLQESDDFNKQTLGHFLLCLGFSAIEMLIYFLVIYRKELAQPDGVVNHDAVKAGVLTRTLQRAYRENAVPYWLAANFAIPPYNYAGDWGVRLAKQHGVPDKLASILVASFFTGYAEQASQNGVNVLSFHFLHWLGPGKQYAVRWYDPLLFFAKTVGNSLLSVRALLTWYPGFFWNLTYGGLTTALNMQQPDTSSAAYWCKLLLLVVPVVTVSVMFSNAAVARTGQTLAEWDAAIWDKMTACFFSGSSGRSAELAPLLEGNNNDGADNGPKW